MYKWVNKCMPSERNYIYPESVVLNVGGISE